MIFSTKNTNLINCSNIFLKKSLLIKGKNEPFYLLRFCSPKILKKPAQNSYIKSQFENEIENSDCGWRMDDTKNHKNSHIQKKYAAGIQKRLF